MDDVVQVPLGLEDEETFSDTTSAMNGTYEDWSTAGFNMVKPLLLAVNTSLQPVIEMLRSSRNPKAYNASMLDEIEAQHGQKEDITLDMTTSQVDLYEEQVSTAIQTIAALQHQVQDLDSSLQISNNNMSALQHEVQSLSEQNQLLTSAKEQLTEEITGWNERVSEMNEQVEILHNEKKDLEESVTFKDNEIEVLKDCLLQLQGLQDIEEDDTEIDNEARVQQLLDVTRVSAKLSLVESEKEEVETKYQEEVKGRRELEATIGSLQQDVDTAQSNYKQAKTNLKAMTEYLENIEVDLDRKLGREEALRVQSDSKLESADGKAASAEVKVTNYRMQIKDLKEELEKKERNFRNQVGAHEKKAHDSWISARAAGRELEAAKREAASHRHRLTELAVRRAKTETAPLYKPSPSGHMDYDPRDMREISPGPPPDFSFDPRRPPPPYMHFDPHGPPFNGPPPPLRQPFPFPPRDFPPHPDDFDRRGPPMDDRDFGPPPMDDRDFGGYRPPPPGMDFGPLPPPGPMHGPGPYPNDMGPPPMDRREPPPSRGPHGPSPDPRIPGIRPGSRGPFPPPGGAPPPGGLPPGGPSFGTPSGAQRTSTPLEGTPVTPQTLPGSRPMQGP